MTDGIVTQSEFCPEAVCPPLKGENKTASWHDLLTLQQVLSSFWQCDTCSCSSFEFHPQKRETRWHLKISVSWTDAHSSNAGFRSMRMTSAFTHTL